MLEKLLIHQQKNLSIKKGAYVYGIFEEQISLEGYYDEGLANETTIEYLK